jgi:hypothetical protein
VSREPSIRAAIVRALEVLEDGDLIEAELILVNALADPVERPARCPVCGLRFRWPGQVDHHVTFVHGQVAA